MRAPRTLLALLLLPGLGAATARAAEAGGAVGTWALDQAALEALVADAPAGQKEQAKAAAQALRIMDPNIVLEPNGKGQMSVTVFGEDLKPIARKSSPITWAEKNLQVTVSLKDEQSTETMSCTRKGKRLRCLMGEMSVGFLRK